MEKSRTHRSLGLTDIRTLWWRVVYIFIDKRRIILVRPVCSQNHHPSGYPILLLSNWNAARHTRFDILRLDVNQIKPFDTWESYRFYVRTQQLNLSTYVPCEIIRRTCLFLYKYNDESKRSMPKYSVFIYGFFFSYYSTRSYKNNSIFTFTSRKLKNRISNGRRVNTSW